MDAIGLIFYISHITRLHHNRAKFSATASLGVLHAGHITEAMTLLEPYLPPNPEPEDATPVTSAGGYAEGGSLYALGLIHGSHAGSSAGQKQSANEFIMKHLRASHANEPIAHGAALGVGLTAMGTNNLSVINELKELIYTDSAVSGEAAGIAIGLVLVGSGAGNVRNNLESNDDRELAPRENKVHSNNTKPPTLNPKRVTFSKEQNGI